MKTYYESEDGKRFIDKNKCIEYEAERERLKAEQVRLKAEWVRLKNEKISRREQIIGLIDKYEKDYNEYPLSWIDLINSGRMTIYR